VADVIVLPKMGLTMESGEVVCWLIGVGDRVTRGQEVVEVDTYKATVTVEATADGVLRAAVAPGETVPAGAVIGIIAEPDEPLDGLGLWSGPPVAEPQQRTGGAQPRPTADRNSSLQTAAAVNTPDVARGPESVRLRASPAARRAARDLGVDLHGLIGSGPLGRITEADVEAAARRAASGREGEDRRIPLTPIRRVTAELMSASAGIPQFTLEATARVGALTSTPRLQGFSIASVIIAAAAAGLRQMPAINASFDDDAIIEHGDVNVGFAVALDEGLLTPVIRNADRLGLQSLDAERTRLVTAARAGTLSPAELRDATFTVSNLGPLGVERFRALVVPPQAAILAVGKMRDQTIALSLSCDHRVLDGALAARFLAAVVARLERPS
jgi:pyruvate dehydrogenase E2 component (dihydrolipoamide acetyltransferase)